MVTIGDYIKLHNNKFHKRFAKSQQWNNSYLWKGHFKNVCLWFPKLNCRGENAKMIFDASCSRVIKIEYDNGEPLFVTTELFWINFPKGLKTGEIEVIKQGLQGIVEYKEDRRTIEGLEFFEEKYLEGLFEVLERENNKIDTYKRCFSLMKREGKWQDLIKNKPS